MTSPLYVAAGIAALEKSLQDTARMDECYRCPQDPAGRIDPLEPDPGLCRACLDEVSHALEQRRHAEALHDLAGPDYDGWVA